MWHPTAPLHRFPREVRRAAAGPGPGFERFGFKRRRRAWFNQCVRATERYDSAADAEPVSVLARGLAIIDAFDDTHALLGVSELARRTGLPKSTVQRLATELAGHGVLERTGAPTAYRLGLWLFERGSLVPRRRSLTEAAEPTMQDLRTGTGGRVHLAVLDGIEVVYVAITGGGRSSLTSRVGGRLPAHATGVGKAILAFAPPAAVRARLEAGLPRLTPRTIITPGALLRDLDRTRTEGIAQDREESHAGISCVAAPVLDRSGQVVAGLSITGPTGSIDPRLLGPAVRTAALTISRAL